MTQLPFFLFYLLVAHAVADYALQSDWMGRAKNPNYERRSEGEPHWWMVLGAHSLIHGGLVGMVTGMWVLGAAEAIVHGYTDYLKCKGKIGILTDQIIHVGSKVLWAVIAALLSMPAGAVPGQ